jgi:DNA processing protein
LALEPQAIPRDAAAYPARLLDLDDAPSPLWVAGDAALLTAAPLVAIVGTRDPSGYGVRITAQLAAAVARAGGVVVSGLARGVDAAAHRAALEAGGRSIGVVATGVDVVTPRGHVALQERLARDGAVCAEWPPGTGAAKWSFLHRNRLIAALAHVVVVVEAGHRSGALDTAARALALSREVAAVPGPIDAPQSQGTNQLLRDGAHVLASVDDLLQLAELAPRTSPVAPAMPDDAARCWDVLGRRTADLEGLVAATGLDAARAAAAVSWLELEGHVHADWAGHYHRRL